MKTVILRIIGTLQLMIFVLSSACVNSVGNTVETSSADNQKTQESASVSALKLSGQHLSDTSTYKVTFIELGSVRCIPCQQMQPIMKSIEENYKGRVKVVFYDVWTQEGRPYADQYEIQVIPTQVFLDENGKEFFRHQGLFPEEEIIELLETKGVK